MTKFARCNLLQTFYKVMGTNTPKVNGRRPLHFRLPKDAQVLLIDYGAHLDAVDTDGSTLQCGNE